MQVRYGGRTGYRGKRDDVGNLYHVYKSDVLIGTEEPDFLALVRGGALQKVYRCVGRKAAIHQVREAEGDFFRVVAALAKWEVIC